MKCDRNEPHQADYNKQSSNQFEALSKFYKDKMRLNNHIVAITIRAVIIGWHFEYHDCDSATIVHSIDQLNDNYGNYGLKNTGTPNEWFINALAKRILI